MSKFKVGDKVVRKSPDGSSSFKKHQGDFDYYTVTAMTSSGHWLQLDNFTIDGDYYPWCAPNFELYQEPDDELPPVPASVAYMNSERDRGNDQRLVLERCSWTDENLLYIGIVPKKNSTRAEHEIGINMSPDAALQLAHDLRRMAMDIKRKGKANA
ncbi:hypothetical protein HOR38_gp36 [Klebsiella phage KPV811]|uniref:Uncharacterized protein n=1 Tax=Klebsiella phage KPV811 TaxID=1913574 RepID=A0A1J0MHN8_9CAUD|nr:hypothetical protein HOR38_gp36 [Klebsiella phage KPV811]APD20691.1 hypothetical protein [Klebsiella phage KPV811]